MMNRKTQLINLIRKTSPWRLLLFPVAILIWTFGMGCIAVADVTERKRLRQ